MSKLVFAGVVFALGVVLPRAVLVLTFGVPATILAFSIFRVIPAGHVGVNTLFGQVDRANGAR